MHFEQEAQNTIGWRATNSRSRQRWESKAGRGDIQHCLRGYYNLFLCTYSFQTLLVIFWSDRTCRWTSSEFWYLQERSRVYCQNCRQLGRLNLFFNKPSMGLKACNPLIKVLLVLLIFQFCKQCNLETVSTNLKFSFQVLLIESASHIVFLWELETKKDECCRQRTWFHPPVSWSLVLTLLPSFWSHKYLGSESDQS